MKADERGWVERLPVVPPILLILGILESCLFLRSGESEFPPVIRSLLFNRRIRQDFQDEDG
jgi:hypothetical protein